MAAIDDWRVVDVALPGALPVGGVDGLGQAAGGIVGMPRPDSTKRVPAVSSVGSAIAVIARLAAEAVHLGAAGELDDLPTVSSVAVMPPKDCPPSTRVKAAAAAGRQNPDAKPRGMRNCGMIGRLNAFIARRIGRFIRVASVHDEFAAAQPRRMLALVRCPGR